MAERALPSSVRGPVECSALLRLASCFAEDMGMGSISDSSVAGGQAEMRACFLEVIETKGNSGKNFLLYEPAQVMLGTRRQCQSKVRHSIRPVESSKNGRSGCCITQIRMVQNPEALPSISTCTQLFFLSITRLVRDPETS